MKTYIQYLTESKTTQSGYIKENSNEKEEQLFFYVSDNDFEKVKKYITSGGDPNIKNEYGSNIIHHMTDWTKENIVDYILSIPNIDVNSKNKHESPLEKSALFRNSHNIAFKLLQHPKIEIPKDFIDKIIRGDYSFNIENLKDYDLQKKILDNGREDILIMFNKYNLINPEIRRENPDLFKAAEWGLIS